MSPEIITPNHALRLKAGQQLVDRNGTPRFTGEEWLVRKVGAYLPGVFEEVRNTKWKILLKDQLRPTLGYYGTIGQR